MTLVIDTDTNCIGHLDDLKRRGVEAIGRYYATYGDKRLTQTEARAVSDAGLKLFTVFEDSGNPPLTIDRGRSDAQVALKQARFIGQPKGSAIYFAMEHLPSGYGPQEIPGIKLYFEGIRRTFADEYAIGCYANGSALAALLDANLITYAWLSASLGFDGSRDFLKTDRWHLQQEVPIDLKWYDSEDKEHRRGYVSVDTNKVQGAEFGAFRLPPEIVTAEAGAEAAMAAVSVPNTAAAVQNSTEPVRNGSKPAPWFADWSFVRVNELAEQGSRLAQHIRDMTAGIWKRRAVLGGGGGTAATLVSQSPDATSWIMAHPFLSMGILAGAIFVAYEVWDQVQTYRIRRGLLSASADGRYKPRGA